MSPSDPKRTLLDLPFPGQASVIAALLDNFRCSDPEFFALVCRGKYRHLLGQAASVNRIGPRA